MKRIPLLTLLTIIFCCHTAKTFAYDYFDGISSNYVLNVPSGTRDSYIAAGGTENVFKGGVIESNGGTAETLAQAVWCEDNKTLYFLNSSTTYAIGDTYDGQTISNIWSGTEITNSGEPAWKEFVMENLTTVVFDQSFYDVLPTTLQSWFQGCKNLSSIIGLEYLNTSEATSMGCMFVDCSSLTSLDLSHFNTRQVTHMDGMFAACSSLVNIDLGSFNTENVVDMNQMFRGCKSLQTIDVSNFDMRNVINMGEMFRGCEMLESINFSGVRTDNIVGMAATFAECPNLKSLDLSSFTTSNVDNMWYTFGACYSLESLDLRNFETDNVQDISSIFQSDHNLKTIYCDNTWHLNSDYPIFEHCNSLVGGTGFSYDENKVTAEYASPAYYFTSKTNAETLAQAIWCEDNKTLYFLNSSTTYAIGDTYDGQSITNVWSGTDITSSPQTPAWYIIRGILTKVIFDASFIDVKPTSLERWFYSCVKLQTVEGMNYLDTSEATTMHSMFFHCFELKDLDLTKFNTSKVTTMQELFSNCRALESIDVSSFDTRNVESMNQMFVSCTSLTTLDLTNFNVEKVTDYFRMFLNCPNLQTIYCNDTWSAESSEDMFSVCPNLVGGTGFSYDENKVTVEYASPAYYFTSKTNIDMSDLLVNPKFQDGFNGWTKHSGTAGGLKAFPCVEVYENTVDVYQEVHNVPAGIYAISVKAFERPALNGNYDGNEKSKVYLYMNQFETPVQNIVKSAIPVDEAIDKENCFISGGYPTEAFFQTDGTTFADYLFSNEEFSGYVPNGMSGASYAFRADRYNQTCYGLVGEDGVMKIGLTSKGENCHWVLWADFKLTYMAKDKTALASVIGYYADLASQITDAGTPDILTLNDAINRAQAATDGETMYTELFNIVEGYNVAIESQKAYPEAISSYEKLRNALDEYGNTASEDVLDEANALFTGYSGLENYEFACSELSDMVEEMEQTVIRLKNSSDFNQNSTISSLTIKKDYELAIPFTAGKKYENKTANIMLDGIYDVLGVNAENIYETIALKVYAEVTRSFTETGWNELTGKLMTLTDIRTETEGWFGRYTNSKNGTETVLEINAPKPHGSGCTFYIQNISLVNGELSFTTGQYPGTLKSGDTDYTYLYIVNGTNAVRIKVYVDVSEPVPQDELELAGETTIDIAMNPMRNNRTKAFSIDMEAIAAALECETSDIDDVFSWTDSGEMSNSHTEVSGGFYFNNDSKIGNWSSNIENTAPFFISVSSLSDGAFAIGQYANYYKDITEDVNLTPDLIFIVGSKYYIVHVRYRITNDDLNNLDTWTCVYSAAYDVQLIDDEGYSQAAESQTSLDLDEIAAAIGSSNPKLYAEYWTTAEDGTESMICTDTYSCSPYPGFWMTGDGRSAGEWGNSPSYGMTYANNGVITYYCIAGAHNAGDEFTSRFYLVNEDNGKYAQITLNAAFVDYRGTSFSVEADDVNTGEETTLSVRMDNNKDIIMTEFYLQLPDGFEIAMDEDGNYQAELNSDRSNGHQLEVGCSNDGIYHFLCYSSRNNTFNSNSGDLINIRLVCSDDVETGTYEGKFMNFVISDVNLNEYNPEDFIFNIEVKNILMGDVNADTRINGLDIVEMVDKILDRPVTGTFIFAAGDFDANGVINGMDLVEEVSLVLSQTASGAKARKAPERLEPDMASTMRMSKNNNGDISVGVESTDDYILAQFVVEFSKDLQLKDFISADRDHVVAWQPIEGNRYMVVCYSMRNETFVDNNDLLRISYEGEGIIKVTDAMLVDKDRNPHYVRNTEYGETTDIELVNGTFTTPTDIYSVTGAIVKKNAKSTKGLGKGIYVVNGKVITIK